MGGLLVLTIFLPLVGAILIWSLAEVASRYVRHIALATTVAVFALAILLIARFPAMGVAPNDSQANSPAWHWFSMASESYGIDIRFSVGLDGLGLWMFGLTAMLMITSVLVSWEAVTEQRPAFYSLLLLLETGMLGVFTARDIILFYVFFEATLIPLFFLIGIWGGSERRYAAIKFFLFTLTGSVLTFLGLLALVLWNYQHAANHIMTFSIPALTEGLRENPMPASLQCWVFFALFAGFAIKVPLFPLHTWLPLAHVEAPTAGSILLAGVLLKIGTYGFLRFSLPMLPDATVEWMPLILTLSVAGVLYGALVALAQKDIKRLIAYSSVSHLGFSMLGIFALNNPGVAGGTLQMISHGLSTGGLFAVVGMLYERYHTREIAAYSGMAAKLPKLACCLVMLTFASVGLPGLCGFASEFPLLLGLFQRGWAGHADSDLLKVVSILALAGIVLGAWYMLSLVRRTFFGPLHEPTDDGHGHGHGEIVDMKPREIAALAPIFVFIFWVGLHPAFFLDRMNPTLEYLTGDVNRLANSGAADVNPAVTASNSKILSGESARVE